MNWIWLSTVGSRTPAWIISKFILLWLFFIAHTHVSFFQTVIIFFSFLQVAADGLCLKWETKTGMTLNGNKPRDTFVRTLPDVCPLPQRRPDAPQGTLLCSGLYRPRQKKLWRPRRQTSCQIFLLRWLTAGVSTERIYIKEQSATEEQRGASPQTSTELCQTAAQRRTKARLDSAAAKCPMKTFLRFFAKKKK